MTIWVCITGLSVLVHSDRGHSVWIYAKYVDNEMTLYCLNGHLVDYTLYMMDTGQCKLAAYYIPDSASLFGLWVLISFSLAYVNYGSPTVTIIPLYNDLIILLVCFCSECFLLPSRWQVSSQPDNIQQTINMYPLIWHLILHSDALRFGGWPFHKQILWV